MSQPEPVFNWIMHWEVPSWPTDHCEVTVDSNGARVQFGINEEFFKVSYPLTVDQAREWYRQNIYLAYHADRIASQQVANYVCDSMVDPGPGAMVPNVHRVLNFQLGTFLDIAAPLGPLTVSAINRADPQTFLHALAELRERVFTGWLDKHPQFAGDRTGLLRRARDIGQPAVLVTDPELSD
jgi:lysozyme family protein